MINSAAKLKCRSRTQSGPLGDFFGKRTEMAELLRLLRTNYNLFLYVFPVVSRFMLYNYVTHILTCILTDHCSPGPVVSHVYNTPGRRRVHVMAANHVASLTRSADLHVSYVIQGQWSGLKKILWTRPYLSEPADPRLFFTKIGWVFLFGSL